MRTRKVTFWMDCYSDDEPLLLSHKPTDPPFPPVKRYQVTIEVPDWLPEGWRDPYAGEEIHPTANVVEEGM